MLNTVVPSTLVCLLICLLVGCEGDRELTARPGTDRRPPAASTPAADPAGTLFPLTVTDGLDRRVTVTRRPERIVSLAPKNTELLFALGSEGRLVGVTSYCNYPPEARQREQVGGFSSQSISIETIVSLQPDLVLTAGGFHQTVISELERLQVPVVALAADSLEGLFDEIRLLGQVTGRQDQAGQLVAGMQRRVEAVRQKVREIEPERRVRVFYRVWDEPLAAAGPESFIGQMIELCGAVNIVADLPERYPRISEELILDRDPDVLLAPATQASSLSGQELLARPGWSRLRAVRSGRIHFIEDDLVSRCGPRLVDALEAMAVALYPDRFADPQAAGEGRPPQALGQGLE